MIDLRSDTVTKPCPGMRKAMYEAEVGDDVFSEDPSILKLEELGASILGMEAGLFCPSGTMANQIALKVHTRPLEEIICDKTSHIYHYEGGGFAFNSGCSIRLLEGDRGRINTGMIASNINPEDVHKPRTSLVSLENTCNKGGGSYYTLKEIAPIRQTCLDNGLKLHLDGARIFNAIVESKDEPGSYGGYFDSISACLSKGLGAPVGSLLLGSKDFIKEARRVRKVLGGGMRQAGILAAAGIYALEHNINRLADDHKNAGLLEKVLNELNYVEHVMPVHTNIVIFKLKDTVKDSLFLQMLAENDIKAVKMDHQTVRFVCHLDITEEMIDQTIDCLRKMEN